MEKTEILVVGGGPGGLACATLLAQKGARVVLAERKLSIGHKVCAGGLPWHGLIKDVPSELIERTFDKQYIYMRRQRLAVAEPDPIIATVNRERLGQWMARQAEEAGVTILTGTRVAGFEPKRATLECPESRRIRLGFEHLVGADGSNSLVRRFLGLQTTAVGIGLNCMAPGRYPRMEWHLDPGVFGSGFGWIFPHGESCSIGIAGDPRNISARILKQQLSHWAGLRGFQLDPHTIRAGLVNHDYRGVRFDHGWLIGDAAGLASGLTGEGIYPALVSGQSVARMILEPKYPGNELKRLVRKHRRHSRVAALAGRSHGICGLLVMTLLVLLRTKIMKFQSLAMAD